MAQIPAIRMPPGVTLLRHLGQFQARSIIVKTSAISNQHIHNLCVFCGSRDGANPAFMAAARSLGEQLGTAGIGLVYGGGSLGMMGEVARSTLSAGGRVTGIIPEFLVKAEAMLNDCDEVIITKDMHERKRLMFERSDAFVALPGGIGTLEELVEQLTWAQLGRHQKPIVVANIDDFWTPLVHLLDHMRGEVYIRGDLDVRYRLVEQAGEIVPAVLEMAVAAGAGIVSGDPAITSRL